MLAGLDGRWRVLIKHSEEQKRAIGDRTRWFDQIAVTVPEGKDLETMKADAETALPHIEKRGGWGMRLTRPAPLKRGLYLRDDVRIGGRCCDTADAVRDLISWLDVRIHLQHLQRLWTPYAQLRSMPAAALMSDSDQLSAYVERALHLLEIKSWLQTLIASVPQLPEPRWHELASVRDFGSAIEAVEVALSLTRVTRKIDEVTNGVRDLIHHARVDPEATTLLAALQRRDADAYRRSMSRIRENTEKFLRFHRHKALLSRLETSAPCLVEELKGAAQDTMWNQRLGHFVEAWNWARARACLERLADSREDARLRLALDEQRKQIRTLLQETAALKAWGHCFERMTEHQRQHLIAWSQAMRRIGRGSGKYARLHRQAAREHMEECRGAIPAWIMPLYRVVESIRPGMDQFDVAIIDEASQSGPEALILTYLAKRLVVVGDDKQISPENVGLDRADVNQLRNRHLDPVPHRDRYGADDSFFDLADIIYPGRIRLREHFRCMPEIIQFSNDLCYQSPPLIPLKQYGSDRLAPVVGAIHVDDGYQKGTTGHVVNEPEAEEIVEYVSRCCEDVAYKEKTFGIISLLGSTQAKVIEGKLVERIGPEQIERRRLTCGDAYAFQGDERDVILLSMVSAAGETNKIRALTRDTDQRRFNVAASRAREQMILFHSVTLNDLSPQCLRYRLLDYCLHPKVAQPTVGGLNIDQLRSAADLADRARTPPHDPFESWFEVDVFLRIAERGYRVVPQYEVAGYRIDLVVEGMENRLAVECDGDQWHGPDRYEHDVSRQRMLERCGWRFWRIRGSAFAVDPGRAMEGLWAELQSNGVFPEGRNARSAPEHVGDEPVAEEDDPPAKRPADRGDTTVIDFPGARAPGRSSDGVPQRQAVPYRVWEPVRLPDPGTASAELLLSGLEKIIDVEGPMLARRAFSLYAKAAGLQRLRNPTQSHLQNALSLGLRRKSILAEQEHAGSGKDRLVIRGASTPQVIVRSRGPREFDEIPPSEIAEVMRRALALDGSQSTEEINRRILDHYQLVRMTKGIVAELNRVRDKFLNTAAAPRQPSAQ
ncbi:MAG: AAA domain-containing protein [Defluviicoccus sp.]